MRIIFNMKHQMSYLLTGDTIYLVTKATPAEQITEHKCITVNMSKHFIFNYLIKSSNTTSSSNVSLHIYDILYNLKQILVNGRVCMCV